MDWRHYEEVVSRLAQQLRDQMPQLREARIAFGRENLIEGASGYCHQIDVSAQTDAVALLVECKCWQDTVDTVNTLTFCARHVDIKSRVGLQKKSLGGNCNHPRLRLWCNPTGQILRRRIVARKK
jgi:hypothetical protein